MHLGPGHLELSNAHRSRLVQHLHTDRGTFGKDCFSDVGLALVRGQQVEQDIGVEENTTHATCPESVIRSLAFRDRVDAEEIAELTRIRKKLKLTQQEAAKLAGGGKNAFSRYERGQAKPVAAVINLFRLLDKHPALLKELRAA